jgi:endonuclease/exonuclease/phosphatase family metal-dependent hydrolase
MRLSASARQVASVCIAVFFCLYVSAAETFRVASFNLENYLHEAAGTRRAKSDESKAKVRESILAMHPDVLALQEMGRTNALFELRDSLRAEGLDYPYWEHITAFDTNIHVAVLSRFPIVARRPHTNDTFLLSGRRFQTGRGFVEVDIQVNPDYQFTLLTAHLKSRRPVAFADQAEFREQEALLLREKIDARLSRNSEANLIVLGDFNDVKYSSTIRTLIGRGRNALLDTRPAERNGDDHPALQPRAAPRRVTWTHYWEKEDNYSRIDYILISRGMSREWVSDETFVLTMPNWGLASDHRPIVATFFAEDR